MEKTEAYERGMYDAARDAAPIFRSTRNGILPTIDDPESDDWSDDLRVAYLKGYNIDGQLTLGWNMICVSGTER